MGCSADALRPGPMTAWTSGAGRGYCEHGVPQCPGWPENGIAPCLPSAHRFCAHGFDADQPTKDGEHRCPWCRGVTRHGRNPDTWRPPRVGASYARGHTSDVSPGDVAPTAPVR